MLAIARALLENSRMVMDGKEAELLQSPGVNEAYPGI